ncbi:MAG: TetR/AcrR family transcriptional regulator [Aquabacterium sp.]|uniref:TetR/AcrR family transcriptional regulator n=1 Tax=Aquabacterium sp. TaxID=1872578 RepID=UPI0027182766|nr:TetR/AcrR family transcriptional regulator [Aquabacterium sp.]MDO9003977.1 TetR/AcrR family transcriptional regulator [Aquabacterium sp.]
MQSIEKMEGGAKRVAPGMSVRERLLDAAEALFADHGFHGAPMREITSKAGTRLANINDHFGSKEALFQEVIARRARLINADRLALLASLPRSRGKAAELQSLVEAFASPLLERSLQGAEWRNYLRLLAQLTNTRSHVLLLIADEFNPIGEIFIDRIGKILPHLTRRQKLNAYQLMVSSAMAIFADTGRIDVLSGGLEQSSDFSNHYKDMVCFVVGGILQLGRQ